MDAEKVSIRRHLGYSAVAESNYPWIDTFHALSDVLDTLPAASETATRAILDHLDNIEERLTGGALSRLKAEAAGPIRLNNREVSQLRGELRRWRGELSTLLGVPMAHANGGIVVA